MSSPARQAALELAVRQTEDLTELVRNGEQSVGQMSECLRRRGDLLREHQTGAPPTDAERALAAQLVELDATLTQLFEERLANVTVALKQVRRLGRSTAGPTPDARLVCESA